MNRAKFLIILLVLVGIYLRIPSLDLGLWRDEASTYFDSLPNNFEEIINTVTYSELNPPIFYLIMHQWMQWFGDQELIFKIPALLFGLLLIPSTYVLGKLTGSPKAGLIAATIATFAQESVYYSQEARPYTLAALLVCWVMFFYCKALATTKHQICYLIGFVICSDILLYVQYSGLLLVSSLIILTLFLLLTHTIKSAMPFALAFGVIFLLFMPWLPIFISHLYTGTPWTIKEPFLRIFYENIGYTLINPRKLNLLFIILGLGIILRKFFQTKSTIRDFHISPEIYTFILGICFIYIIAIEAIFSYKGRYILPFAPIAWAFYGSCLLALSKFLLDYVNSNKTSKWQYYVRQAILGLLVILLIFSVINRNKYDLSFGNIDKSGIKTLAKSWQTRKDDKKTLYILSPDFLAPTFGYYFSKHPVQFYGFARWDKPEIFSPQNYAEIWANPMLLEETERLIQKEIKKGYRKLALISDNNISSDLGKMKYSKTIQFLDTLKKRYNLLEKADYRGLNESISLYLFDLNSNN
ncbi:glycosyltransferase family 39 protein [Pseudanabaena sp. FACHB-1998]|uniref:glycosyltransferase family 39 protein n=1 Tax=Pseudanabaena sp. FACHB-1998 TaxID=2692858 RepID=UPI0016807446|nr:glycosyltransferase family 39 protein [Pseudanabaena sp. FACHB-1998]MBD2176011.1 glycosyltransferase family 39 protein [Pseudanabaena sp. FACHB-1998]